jgi:hypothetical protein
MSLSEKLRRLLLRWRAPRSSSRHRPHHGHESGGAYVAHLSKKPRKTNTGAASNFSDPSRSLCITQKYLGTAHKVRYEVSALTTEVGDDGVERFLQL